MSYLNNKLLLASSSKSRQNLLDQIKISYQVIKQDYDESKCSWDLPIDKLVLQLAVNKMDHAIIPNLDLKNHNIAQASSMLRRVNTYVLSADTLSEDVHGNIHGKPKDYEDAVNKIKVLRDGSFIYTAFCLDKRIYQNNTWKILERKTKVVSAKCIFDVPDKWIDIYLNNTVAMQATGAIVIDEFGLQFLKSIEGSYTAIIGLPLLELRQALEELNFFDL